jgi:hypothetical protein
MFYNVVPRWLRCRLCRRPSAQIVGFAEDDRKAKPRDQNAPTETRRKASGEIVERTREA